MRSVKRLFWTVFLTLPLLCGSAQAYEVDDYVPDVQNRVARISFIRGDVQIRRVGADNWEKADLNLPIVEGDEITTDSGSRFEIQFGSNAHLRIAENSYLKILKLRDEGIAVSLPQGIASVRLTKFDLEREFFEIDAPNTTISLQREGLYRVDSGGEVDQEIRVSARDNGEARIYSVNSGFTLKSGRSAKVFVEGSYAGEFETGDAARYADEFDSWVLDRDAVIAKRLRDAHYDKYYDRDIYGAEDLSEYGDWVHTRKYGYVWRPYRTAISSYSDWSPYRYGHWRWVPPYGWTWVNDEPWGWATYHHGRWIWDDGGWVWTPYGYYRNRRSWWQPALVVISVINRNICWYPLPYDYAYYNYNVYNIHNNYGRSNRNQPGNRNTVSTSTPKILLPNQTEPDTLDKTPPLSRVPAGGVVITPVEEFGKSRVRMRTASPGDARVVLSKRPDSGTTPPILLPTYEEVKRKINKEIVAETPPILSTASRPIKTGAATRKTNAPLDQELRKTRIFGDRPPAPLENTPVVKTGTGGESGPRKTGAVGRPQIIRSEEPQQPAPTKQDTPVYTPRTETPPYVPPAQEKPRYDPPPRQKREEPRYEPPREKREEPRYEPPPRQKEPEYVPPPRNETPPYVPPQRNDPPPQKSDPPPSKSEPNKPDSDSGGRKKDG